MPGPPESSRLASNDRLREVATILATAILRLRSRTALPDVHSEESPPTGLEVSPDTRLSVHRG